MPLDVKNCATEDAIWAGALSWWRIQFVAMIGQTHMTLSESFKNVFVLILIDTLSSGNPLFMNNTHGIKEAHKHAFHFWLGHACLLWPWWSLWTPFQTLAFGLWIILEKPTLIANDNSGSPSKSFPCVGGTVTEFNTKKKDGITLSDIPCFHFRDKVHKYVLTCHAPTSQWVTAKPCHCKSG